MSLFFITSSRPNCKNISVHRGTAMSYCGIYVQCIYFFYYYFSLFHPKLLIGPFFLSTMYQFILACSPFKSIDTARQINLVCCGCFIVYSFIKDEYKKSFSFYSLVFTSRYVKQQDRTQPPKGLVLQQQATGVSCYPGVSYKVDCLINHKVTQDIYL